MDAKNEYLLLFRGKEWWSSITPEELQKTMDQVKSWFERLTESGKLKAAQPLVRAGATVSGNTGRVIADGPYAESKEVIGGYALVQVDSLDEAIAIAESCPTLRFGMEVEVRPVAEECPLMSHARQNLAEALLATAAA
ncbi:MAG TPA: YciI family protein [Verrucomicrobiae bacterium]|nr:YciI family protein [Verrucomicrobiae bacterium]